VKDTRKIGKKDMKLNNAMPKMSGSSYDLVSIFS